MQDNTVKKTAPFRTKDGDKPLPVVNMSPWHPIIERFVVPTCFFAAGFLVAKLFVKPTVIKAP